MSFVNAVFNGIFDLFFSVTGFLGSEVAMWIFSAIAGVGFLFVFKWTSNQKAIKRIKDRISAGFLAIRLFKDDFGQVWKANGSVFGNAFKYMAQALRPMLFMILPVLFILPQINHWYGYKPLEADQGSRVLSTLLKESNMTLTNPVIANTSTIVTVRLGSTVDVSTASIEISTDPGLNIATSAVRIPEKNEVSWRVQATENGEHQIHLKVNDSTLSHTIFVGEEEKFRKISPVTSRDPVAQFFYPANSAIPGNVAVEEVTVSYQERNFNLLGLEVHWIIAFFIISLIVGFALKGVLGVEI